MKKSKKTLNLNKLVISKLNNSRYIMGGGSQNCVTTKSQNPDPNCPSGSLTCPSFYESCEPCEDPPPISGIGC